MPAAQPAIKRLWQSIRGRRRREEPSPLHTSPRGTFVFIHINKTAGTSIGQAIGIPKKQHLTSREVIEIIGREQWRRAFRFSIVRNPWDKVVSHYKHRVTTNQTAMQDRPIPFREWVAATYLRNELPYYDQPKMFQPQVEWLKDDRREIDIDLIGRFEDLRGAFEQITARLGVQAELPHLNRTEKTDYRTFYDDSTADVVARWFREDIARFGYRFDG